MTELEKAQEELKAATIACQEFARLYQEEQRKNFHGDFERRLKAEVQEARNRCENEVESLRNRLANVKSQNADLIADRAALRDTLISVRKEQEKTLAYSVEMQAGYAKLYDKTQAQHRMIERLSAQVSVRAKKRKVEAKAVKAKASPMKCRPVSRELATYLM